MKVHLCLLTGQWLLAVQVLQAYFELPVRLHSLAPIRSIWRNIATIVVAQLVTAIHLKPWGNSCRI